MKNTTLQLSDHFSLEEFVSSATAAKLHIDNRPGEEQIEAMRNLCNHVLEPLRKAFGPICINSGFRSAELNVLLHGAGNSQHLKGEAADIRLRNAAEGQRYFDFILQHCPFDQLLFEHSRFGRIWIHVSCKQNLLHNRHMALRCYRPLDGRK